MKQKICFFYFSCELILIAGVFLNLFLLPFRKKDSIKKISNNLTVFVLGFNIITLPAVYLACRLSYISYDYSIFTYYFEPDSGNLLLKILINIFILLFVLVGSNYTKKYKFRLPVINSIALLLALSGCLIAQAGNYILELLTCCWNH